MEDRLKEALWDGEEVRWSGRPKPFRLLEQPYKSSILLTWVISALVLAVTVILLAPALIGGTRSLGDVAILATITLFLPVILSFRPVMDQRCLENQTLYAITNFRIIAVIKDDVMYLPISKQLKSSVEEGPDGCGNLRFGALVGQPEKKGRAHAVLGMRTEGTRNTMEGLLFYHVEHPDQLSRYFA